MINFLKKYFTKKSQQQKIDTTFNSVKVILDNNGEIDLEIVINNNNNEAENFANTLFLLNSGYYADKTVNILLEIYNKYPDSQLFIARVISAWYKLMDIDNKNSPLVKPSEFGASK